MNNDVAGEAVNSGENAGAERWLDYVREQVRSLRFGLVQIVVHDSQVVEIDRTDKVRFTSLARSRRVS